MTPASDLITAFEAWADRRGRVVEPSLVGAVLSAHAACLVESGGTGDPLTWRAGEAYDAVVRAVASDTFVLLPGTDMLRGTLDAFFRFLRNTGRLRSGSADVVTLRRECARAVGLVKRAIEGLELLGPLSEASTGWLDDDEDDWLHPEDPQYRTRDLVRALGLRGSPGLPLPSVEQAAAKCADGGYMTSLFRLVELIADGVIKPLSAFPGPDEAEEFAKTLDLSGVDEFEDLWLMGVLAGVIRGFGDTPLPPMTRAEFDALSAGQRLMRVCNVGKTRIRHLCDEEAGSGAITLLVWSLLQGGAWVPLAEAVKVGAQHDYWYDENRQDLALADLDRCLELLVNAGIVERVTDRARLTDFGRWAVDLWLDDLFDRS